MYFSPFSSASGYGSCSHVSTPACTPSWAMPAPMVPAPTTPTLPGGSPTPGMLPSPRQPASHGTSLSTLEIGAPLLDEGGHALDPVLGGHPDLEQPALVLEPRGQACVVGGQHGLLGQPRRDRGPARDHLGQLERPVHPLLLLGHLVDQPEAVSVVGGDP